jgi:DNA repair exonuclease SbcCD nuclease subunit
VLDLFESLGLATRLGSEPTVVDGVAFYGLDFVPGASRTDLVYDFEPAEADHTVLVTHGLFEPFPHGDWDLREVLAGSPVSFDAVLLGDDHTPRTRELDDPHEAWVTYCGSTERASAAEREERGYNLVVFEDGVDVRRRGLDTREFVFVDLELGQGEGVERVRERIGQHDVADAVVVVSIDGAGEPVTPAAVEEYGDEQGALVTRVTDHREFADESEVEVSFADPRADQGTRAEPGRADHRRDGPGKQGPGLEGRRRRRGQRARVRRGSRRGRVHECRGRVVADGRRRWSGRWGRRGRG